MSAGNLSKAVDLDETASLAQMSHSQRQSPTVLDSKVAQLRAQIAQIQEELTDTHARLAQLDIFPDIPDTDDRDRQEQINEIAQKVVKDNIERLMRYNKTKDAAMQMLEVVAEQQGKRLTEVMEDRDIESK